MRSLVAGPRRRIGSVILVAALQIGAVAAVSSPAHAAGGTIRQHIAVPAYFLPNAAPEGSSTPYWTTVASSAPATSIAVVNVLNGPDLQPISAYASAIQAAHNAGIKVLGYVDSGYFGTTGLATRLGDTSTAGWTAQIEHDVNDWYTFYGSSGLDGIFFDQGQNVCGTGNSFVNLYKTVNDYVKHNHTGALTVINPGIAVPRCYEDAADVLLTFEGTYASYNCGACTGELDFHDPGWDPVDPNKFWHLVYDTAESNLSSAIGLSKQRKAGYVYVTEDKGANPWDSLPGSTYWNSEQALVGPGGTSDTTNPSTPQSLDTVEELTNSVILDWAASTDAGSGVVGYDVFAGPAKVKSVPGNVVTATVTGLTPSTSYTFTVRARDGAGNVSAASAPLTVSTEPAFGIRPTAPTGVTSSATTYTSTKLSWTASTDSDDTISAYDVFQGATRILTLGPSATSTPVIGLSPGLSSTFTVKARDTHGNISLASNAASVTTTSLPGGLSLANGSGTLSTSVVTYSADFRLPFAFRRVFIDSDNNPSTGYAPFFANIGADFMIEGDRLFTHTHVGQLFSFNPVKTVTPSTAGERVTWQLAASDIGSPTTEKVVFQAEGFAPMTNTPIITINRS